MSHQTVRHYYEMNFNLMHHHKWSMGDLNELIPWERDIYTGKLLEALEEEVKEREKQNQR